MFIVTKLNSNFFAPLGATYLANGAKFSSNLKL
jgi:hypothetical protein